MQEMEFQIFENSKEINRFESKMQHFNTSYDLVGNLVYLYFRPKFYV